MAGSSTELYSEVLAQLCLAYSIVYNKAATKEEILYNIGLNPKVVAATKKYIISQSSVNLTNPSFVSGFVKYISGNVSGKLGWIDAQGKNMFEVKKRFKIGPQHKIYNDKLFGNTRLIIILIVLFLKQKLVHKLINGILLIYGL